MTVELKCSGCQTQLRLPDELAGKRAKCVQCGTVFTIPSATEHFWPPGMGPAPTAVHRPANGAAPQLAKAGSSVPAPHATPVARPTADVPHGGAPLTTPNEAGTTQPQLAPSLRETVPIARTQSTRDTTHVPAEAKRGARPLPVRRTSGESKPGDDGGPAAPRLQLGDVLARSRGIFRSNLGLLLLAGFVFLVLNTALNAGSMIALAQIGAPPVVQFLAAQALTVWLLLGLVATCVHAARGRPMGPGTLFKGFPLLLPALAIWAICFAPLVLAAVAMSVAAMAPPAMFALLGGLWLLVFGTLWIPSLVALVDHPPRPLAAMRSALAYTADQLPIVLSLLVISLLTLVAATIPAGLGLPLAVPFVLLLNTVSYLRGRPSRG